MMSDNGTPDMPHIDLRIIPRSSFGSRGFPHADEFYHVLLEHLPSLLRHRYILSLCNGVTIEHIEAARDAVDRMREIEEQPVPVVQQDVPSEGGGTYPIATLDDIEGRLLQYTSSLRFSVTESCAALEALAYELVFALQIVPKHPDGADNERAIGFLYNSVKNELANKVTITGSQALRLLREHLEGIDADPRHVDLDAMRRVSFHRRLDFLQTEVTSPVIDTEHWTFLPTAPPPRILRPDRIDDLVGSFEQEIIPSAFLSDTLVWLTEKIDEAYRLATRFLQDT